MSTNSIGVRKWSAGKTIEQAWRNGELIGWKRADGARIIETNGDPIEEEDEGFNEVWERRTL